MAHLQISMHVAAASALVHEDFVFDSMGSLCALPPIDLRLQHRKASSLTLC